MNQDVPVTRLVLNGEQVKKIIRRQLDEMIEYMWHHDNSLKISDQFFETGEDIRDCIARNLAIALTGSH